MEDKVLIATGTGCASRSLRRRMLPHGFLERSWLCARGVSVHSLLDRCRPRGTRLSIGRLQDDQLRCAYHGWRFAEDGHCSEIPALPGFVPPKTACATSYSVLERHGLVWVCLGSPRSEPPPFPEVSEPGLRAVVCGPYDVAASAPRIVENFLDMAHFAYVHRGILGDPAQPQVKDYEVNPLEGGGLLATRCFAWQPRANSVIERGERSSTPIAQPPADGGRRNCAGAERLTRGIELQYSRRPRAEPRLDRARDDDRGRARKHAGVQGRIFSRPAILENQRRAAATASRADYRREATHVAGTALSAEQGLREGFMHEGLRGTLGDSRQPRTDPEALRHVEDGLPCRRGPHRLRRPLPKRPAGGQNTRPAAGSGFIARTCTARRPT